MKRDDFILMSTFLTFKEGLEKDLSIISMNKYTYLIFFIMLMGLIISLVYNMNKRKIINKKQDNLPHLFKETLDNLQKQERSVCEVLNETEGVSEDYLSEKLDLGKEKLQKSLKILEKRQIIKERNNKDKVYLSDWLK